MRFKLQISGRRNFCRRPEDGETSWKWLTKKWVNAVRVEGLTEEGVLIEKWWMEKQVENVS
jgi:hypothetical protein